MARRRLTIIVVVHRMARQAANCIWSLTADRQQNVSAADYKIVVIENESDDVLGKDAAESMGANVHWFLSKARTQTPVFALGRGLLAGRTEHVGAVLDAAYIFTPRVVELTIVAARLAPNPVIAVPTYHLGEGQQHQTSREGYGEERERKLLDELDWRVDPYRLFQAAVPAPGNERGYLLPMAESGAVFVRRELLTTLQPELERFWMPGGGHVATYLLHEACRSDDAELIVLAGEGAFHQYHGGLLTSHHEDRAAVASRASLSLASIAGGPFERADVEPRLFGVISGAAHLPLRRSIRFRKQHEGIDVDEGDPSLDWTTSDTMDGNSSSRPS